jgi:hypothetical protein
MVCYDNAKLTTADPRICSVFFYVAYSLPVDGYAQVAEMVHSCKVDGRFHCTAGFSFSHARAATCMTYQIAVNVGNWKMQGGL